MGNIIIIPVSYHLVIFPVRLGETAGCFFLHFQYWRSVIRGPLVVITQLPTNLYVRMQKEARRIQIHLVMTVHRMTTTHVIKVRGKCMLSLYLIPEVHSEPCQRSQMEIYAKIVNGWAVNYFHKKDSSQIFYWLLFTPIHAVFLYIHKQPLKVFRKSYSWKFRKFHRKTPFLQSLSNKYAGLQACYVIKMRPQHKCFPVKFLRTLILKNIWKRLLLYIAAVLKTH